MKDEALRLALEGFENIRHHFDTDEYAYEVAVKSITAIKQVLEQPEQEPVAWKYKVDPAFDGEKWHDRYELTESKSLALWKDKDAMPLYTSPPKREWQGLTDEERAAVFGEFGLELLPVRKVIAEEIEAKLKEKNT